MGFEHFQTFNGRLELPPGFIPRVLTVTIRPDGEQLAENSSAFPWPPVPDQPEVSPQPSPSERGAHRARDEARGRVRCRRSRGDPQPPS